MPSSTPPPGAAAELVPPWLKSLPLAPEFHPTAAEFADPIAYILKIEPAAAPFGVCKIVPPYPPPPKKPTLSNLSRSFAALHPDDPSPSFPTRHQQLGLCPRRPRPALKPVWRSSHLYTLPQFESKAAASRKALLARLNASSSKHFSPLDLDALFWRAAADRPVTVEYASDMPGSGFAPSAGRLRPQAAAAAQVNVGETAWNMRGVARSPGSLLRFMPEEIPGVTSPMLYVAMMFSWFAWHVEDHDLHSLNYLHFGAAKTWYGVPRDAALALEEVVRVHGYGGEVNPLETFAMLGEKTTVMSPEVLVGLGIPCCRLVQNAGEFVVTFPGSYHCGFSHGFNCGEASNIATPEWLRVAKEAAIRRASINRPPLVSHYQLLYGLALSMCSRGPFSGAMEPRSSRLKEKKKGEGEQLVKKIFVRNVIEDNELLSHLLNDGSSCIILPTNAHDGPVLLTALSRSQTKTKSMLSDSLCSREEALEASECLPFNGTLGRNSEIRNCNALSSPKESSLLVCSGKRLPPTTCMHDCVDMTSSSDTHKGEGDKGDIISGTGLLDQGLLCCVTCGILSFSCVAVIKPREHTAKYLMSADYSLINGQLVGSGGSHLADVLTSEKTNSGTLGASAKNGGNGSYFERYGYGSCSVQVSDSNEVISDTAPLNGNSALDLLASAYGDQSDSDEEVLDENFQLSHNSNELSRHMIESQLNSSSHICDGPKVSSSSTVCQPKPSSHSFQCIGSSDISNGPKGVRTRNKYQLKMVLSEGFQPKDMYSSMEKKASSSKKTLEEPLEVSGTDYDASCNNATVSMGNHRSSTTKMSNLTTSMVTSDKDSSRMHVFCLEHAIEVEKQLQAIGGVHIVLLCRPEYPKIEAEARLLAEEMEVEYDWKDIHFREANMEDREKIQDALQDEETIPTNSDWAVKLGINLYYSANLAKSPLYNKQMPYNRVIYRAFGCNSPNNSPVKLKTYGRRQARQKKIVFAGRWCGRVWMSNQVHPYLAQRIENHELEETDGICSYHLDQKLKAEQVDNSSGAAASKSKSSSKTASIKSSKKRNKKPLEKTNTKRPKHTEEDNSRALKVGAEAASSSPTGMVLRSSSRIANRANELKSKMKEEDGGSASHPKAKIKEDDDGHASHQMSKVKEENNGPASHQKSKVKEENDGPTSRSRARPVKQKAKVEAKKQIKKTRAEKRRASTAPKDEEEYTCDIEGCSMSFGTKQELSMHKRDICPVKGCGKKFFSHKYLLQHRKVHIDDRPLKCPWKGCNMAFKWPWARTEHIRVHTGDRPYVCHEPGCGQTFRFVSDFSRHKRKTGHSAKKTKAKR